MKHFVIMMLSVMLFIAFAAPVTAQEEDEDTVFFQEEVFEYLADMDEDNVELNADCRRSSRRCRDYKDADYKVKSVHLNTDSGVVTGKVRIKFERRGRQFVRIKIRFIACSKDWTLLATRLYVGLTPPPSLRPRDYPYKQDTAEGSRRHEYIIELDDLGTQFENLYIAMNAYTEKVGADKTYDTGEIIAAGDRFKVWGHKTKHWPIIENGQEYNVNGDPWGTVFTHLPWNWPAYVKVYLPYEKDGTLFECPQPRGRARVYRR